MALNPTTPGVYVEEVSTLPSSVVPVPTAIPVFIGYTDHVEVDGNLITSFPTNPIRVESFMEFQNIFGGAYSETFTATLTTANVDVSVERTTATTDSGAEDFRLFYNMQMYFANGGGPCYIISAGSYADGPVDKDVLYNSIAKAEQVDEITLVVVPEAMASSLDNSDRRVVYDGMLAHCAKMQDRFSLLDVLVDTDPMGPNTIANDAEIFRNDAVGANNLSYGAAYYPSFDSALSFSYTNADVEIDASDLRLPASVQAFDGLSLNDVKNGNGLFATATIDLSGATFPLSTSPDATVTINGEIVNVAGAADSDAVKTLINANSSISPLLLATESSDVITLTSLFSSQPLKVSVDNISPAPIAYPVVAIAPDKALYNQIVSELDSFALELYPSSTMAGIYAAVDNSRGVWKAPANTSVSFVDSLNRNIKDSDQGGLNVDPTSGKSIDAIREFPGRGMLVWGARTLDGNSNDFRYVNVRRTLIFIEDSCKHASEFVVFEPNDKNTWIRVKGMIGNFLTNLWRDGALVGAKPEQAFFVQVGLGETMTAQDILEGRMIVLIGVAISHPAEFILLRFEHKLQES